MSVKAVLNLKNFLYGKSNSAASLIVPTESLTQDVFPYKIDTELSISSIIAALISSSSATKSSEALYKFLRKIQPLFSTSEGIQRIFEELGKNAASGQTVNYLINSLYIPYYKQLRYYEYLYNKLKALEQLVEETDANEVVYVKDFDDTVNNILDEKYWYDTGINWKVTSLDVKLSGTKASPGFLRYSQKDYDKLIPNPSGITIDDPIITVEYLDLFIDRIQAAITYMESGVILDETVPEIDNTGQVEEVPIRPKIEVSDYVPFHDFQEPPYHCETFLPEFFYLLKAVESEAELQEILNRTTDVTEREELNNLILAKIKEIDKQFNSIRFIYNRMYLEEYRKSAVEFPYFLDLGMDDVTLDDRLKSSLYMHSLEREVKKDDNWTTNHLYGDRLRIRDMFRVDKLNKKSAYESAALFPGISGNLLDDCLEKEDVVTRLVQNDWDVNGILGLTSTPDGIYLLTDDSDVVASAIRGTKFEDAEKVYQTNTFRNFTQDIVDANYLTSITVPSTISFQRVYGGPSDDYSSSNEFLKWYKEHDSAVKVYPGVVYAQNSLLKFIGPAVYEFYPSTDGINRIKDIYQEDIEDEDSFALPNGNLELRACFGDSNYRTDVTRGVSLEIPYNKNSQYSYITFSFGLFLDPDFATLFSKDKTVAINLSLDDDSPISLKFSQENLPPDENHELYYSIIQLIGEKGDKIMEEGRMIDITIKIQNDLIGESTRKLNIGIVSNYSPLMQGVSETIQRAYNNSYVLIKNPVISITNVETKLTYGNYNEYKDAQGDSVLDYWNLSRSVHGAPYQYLLEVPSLVSLGINKQLVSNYNTADLYSDIITLKNPMDSEYRMQVNSIFGDFILDRFRRYTGVDSCSGIISLYYDSDLELTNSLQEKNSDDESLAKTYEVTDKRVIPDKDDPQSQSGDSDHAKTLRYKRIETIKSINRFTESIKHKSNLFSVIVHNSTVTNAGKSPGLTEEQRQQELKTAELMKKTISEITRRICDQYAPAHNQLFKVYFED